MIWWLESPKTRIELKYFWSSPNLMLRPLPSVLQKYIDVVRYILTVPENRGRMAASCIITWSLWYIPKPELYSGCTVDYLYTKPSLGLQRPLHQPLTPFSRHSPCHPHLSRVLYLLQPPIQYIARWYSDGQYLLFVPMFESDDLNVLKLAYLQPCSSTEWARELSLKLRGQSWRFIYWARNSSQFPAKLV